jgi:predicted ATPase
VSSPVLDLEGLVVGRRDEFAELRAAVDEAGRAGGGFTLLSGTPGVGKSTLMHALGAEVSGRNCVFAYGRYQDGAAAPYSALGVALGSLVRSMEATGTAERDRWRADLVSEMSALTGILEALVPDLARVLGPAPQVADLDAADARRRLQRAVIRLVSTTAAYRPVVLAIDDLQWADRDSLLLLSELLTVSVRNVLVLGAHRAGEFDPTAAGLTSAGLRRIDLAPLSRGDLEELLEAVCGRGVELGDVADEFHHRTQGNPLQVRQLLHRAQREGALVPLGAGGRPTWDLRLLTSIEITATAAEFLGRYLDQLRTLDREVLNSLACIGGEFDLADATAAAAQPADVVAQALWSGLELRLLEAVDSRGQDRQRDQPRRPVPLQPRPGGRGRSAGHARSRVARDAPADRSSAGRAGRRSVVRGRPPRRHRWLPTRRGRAHPIRRRAAPCITQGPCAGIVPTRP